MHKETHTAHLDRILVVDDTTANLQLLTNLLTAHGNTVHSASDGELAWPKEKSIRGLYSISRCLRRCSRLEANYVPTNSRIRGRRIPE